MIRKALYAGTFDPITYGHMEVISQAVKLFDELVIAVGNNPEKKSDSLFTVGERIDMIGRSIAASNLTVIPIKVTSFSISYQVDFAKSCTCTHIIRGIRNPDDFEYERKIMNFNRSRHPDIEHVYIIPDTEYIDISSSMVKGLMGPTGWPRAVARYVPRYVADALVRKWEENHEG